MKRLILFDFDGTLTYKDSLTAFFKFAYQDEFRYQYYFRLAFHLVLLKLKLIDYNSLKEKRIKNLISFFSAEDLKSISKSFRDNELPGMLKQSALAQIDKYKKDENNEFVIVSASLDILLTDWAKSFNMQLITNELLIGEIPYKHKNDCNFGQKVIRIKEVYNLDDYSEIIAYGDSEGDREMLEMADIGYFDYFK